LLVSDSRDFELFLVMCFFSNFIADIIHLFLIIFVILVLYSIFLMIVIFYFSIFHFSCEFLIIFIELFIMIYFFLIIIYIYNNCYEFFLVQCFVFYFLFTEHAFASSNNIDHDKMALLFSY
jgi:hypothetical protein